MKRRKNLLRSIYPDQETFSLASDGFRRDFIQSCLSRVWAGWDSVLEREFAAKEIDPSKIDWMNIRQRERSLAFLHVSQIQEKQAIEDPFIVLHEPPEFESSHSDQAMPPAYDFAFYLRGGNRRIAFPIEAKYLKNEKDVKRICSDLSEKYLTAKGSPLSKSAVLVGYLLSGMPSDASRHIAQQLSCKLDSSESFPEKPHWESSHQRNQEDFICHWLICTWN